VIDAGVRHDETEAMLDDEHVHPMAHDPPRLRQDDLDQARVLVDESCELLGLRRWRDGADIDVAPFRLRDDLLRDDEHIAVGELKVRRGNAFRQQRAEIVPRLDQRQAGQGTQGQRGGRHRRVARSSRYPKAARNRGRTSLA
jgi:hypothetical protein